MDVTDQFHLLLKKDLADIRYEDKSLMPDDYAKQLSPQELQNLLVFLKTLKVRDMEKVAAQSSRGEGLSYEPASRFSQGTAELAHLLGRLPGPALLGLKQIHYRQCEGSPGSLGMAVPRRRCVADHAARGGWRDVHDRSRGLRLCVGCADWQTALAIPAPG